jgi:hypothetical protein
MRVPFVPDKSSIQGTNIIKYWFEENPELDSFSLAGQKRELFFLWLKTKAVELIIRNKSTQN